MKLPRTKAATVLGIAAMLLASSGSFAAMPVPSGPDVIWRGGFDGTAGMVRAGCDLEDGYDRALIVRQQQFQITSNPVAEGQSAARFEVKFGDVYPNMSDSRALLEPC